MHPKISWGALFIFVNKLSESAMKYFIFIIIYLTSYYSFSQFYIERASFDNNNGFTTSSTNQNNRTYIINTKSNNNLFGGGYSYNDQLLKINELGQAIDSVELPLSVLIGRVFEKNNNIYLIGDTLRDSLPEQRNIILLKLDMSLNVLLKYQFGNSYYSSFIISGGIDSSNNLYTLCRHRLTSNQPTSKFILYKFNQNLQLIDSLTLNSLVDYDEGGSMLIDGGKIFVIGTFLQSLPTNNNGLQLNILDTALTHLSYFNLDSIGFNPNPFDPQNIGTSVYSTIKRVTQQKFFITSIFQIDRATTFGNMQLDYDVVSTFYNPQTNQVFNFRNYWAADTTDYTCFNQSADVIGNRIYVGGVSNVKLDFPDLYYTNTKNYVCVTLLDSLNNLVWEKKLGGDANYFPSSITATPDSGAIIVGMKYDSLNAPTIYTTNAFAWKLDKNGNIEPIGLKKKNELIDLTIFPNPSCEQFVFKSGNKSIEEIKVYDLNGKLCLSGKYNGKEAKVNGSSLLPATYIYSIKLKESKQLVTGKIIKTN